MIGPRADGAGDARAFSSAIGLGDLRSPACADLSELPGAAFRPGPELCGCAVHDAVAAEGGSEGEYLQ